MQRQALSFEISVTEREGFPGAARLFPRARTASRSAGRPEPRSCARRSRRAARSATTSPTRRRWASSSWRP